MKTRGPEQIKFEFVGPPKKEREHKDEEYVPETSVVPKEILEMMERIKEARAKQGETLDRRTLYELARIELNWEKADKRKAKRPGPDLYPEDPLLR